MNEWETKPLSEVAKVIDSLHKTPTYQDDGLPMVRVTDIQGGYLGLNQTFKVSEETYEEFSKKHKPKHGDLVFSRVGTYGSVSFVKDNTPFCLGQNTVFIIPKISPYFLFYFLNSPYALHQINSFATGSTQKTISLASIKSIDVFIPPKEEQDKIAEVLSCLDRKIENLRRQNETLEAIAQTLFKHWFIDFEFPNADGKPYKSSGGEMERSELGEIPAGWCVGSLGDVVKINFESIGKGYPHKEIEYVDISSVGVGVLEGTTSYPLKKAPSRARRLVKHGNVIWSGVRPNRKSYLFIAHPPENLVVSTGFITLTPDLIPSSYLYSWVTTDSFVEYLTFNASGSAYPAVKAEHFEIAEILLPDKFTLSRFHAVVDPMRDKIHKNSQQIQTLTQTRDVLLPKLMSGKLRITP